MAVNEHPPKVIQLHFAPTYETSKRENRFRLVEANDAIIDEIERGKVSFRGASDQSAALTTARKTYRVRLAESSNQFLLVKSSEVVGPIVCHYELEETRPFLEPVRLALLE